MLSKMILFNCKRKKNMLFNWVLRYQLHKFPFYTLKIDGIWNKQIKFFLCNHSVPFSQILQKSVKTAGNIWHLTMSHIFLSCCWCYKDKHAVFICWIFFCMSIAPRNHLNPRDYPPTLQICDDPSLIVVLLDNYSDCATWKSTKKIQSLR